MSFIECIITIIKSILCSKAANTVYLIFLV